MKSDAIHADDVKQLETVADLFSGLTDRDEIAEIVGMAYAIGRNRGQLEGAIRVANQIGAA